MQSKAMKDFMAKLYGFGAAIVIVGAMFKIMHWPGAGAMLVCGLSTEAVIFFFSAFEKPHEEVDWTLVYPELAMGHGNDDAFGDQGHDEAEEKKEHTGTIVEQLDEMLEEAKVAPELISSLGEGLKSFSQNVSSMSNLSETSIATDKYNENVKKAADSLGSMNQAYLKGGEVMSDLAGVSSEIKSGLNEVASATSEYSGSMKSASHSLNALNSSYSKAAEAAEKLASISSAESAKGYNDQLQKVTQNLSSLNSMYEMELKDSDNRMDTLKEFYGGMANIVKAGTTKNYSDNLQKVTENLSSLNSVYENELRDSDSRLNTLKEFYGGMTEVIKSGVTKNYNDKLQKVTENLSSLSSMYTTELQNSEKQFHTLKEFYMGMGEILKSIKASAEDTRKYKEEIATLNQNLATLNAVYGNMLSAMRTPFNQKANKATAGSEV